MDEFLSLLGEEIGSRPQNHLEDWWKQIDEWKAKKCLDFDRTSGVIKPQQVMEAVYRITKGQAYVASDVGQHQMFAALHYPFDFTASFGSIQVVRVRWALVYLQH